MPIPLSRIIRPRLAELGLSVDDLIDRSTLAKSTIYSYLSGTREPQGAKFRLLAAGLGWSAAELQARIDGTALVAPTSDEQTARIVELLLSVPKDRLDAIEQHVTLAVQPIHGVKRRSAPTDNSLPQSQPELGTPARTRRNRRDTVAIPTSNSGLRGIGHTLYRWVNVGGLLSLLTENRDFHPTPASA